jgi:hypothetical protein
VASSTFSTAHGASTVSTPNSRAATAIISGAASNDTAQESSCRPIT